VSASLILGVSLALTGCNTTSDSGNGPSSAAVARDAIKKELMEKPYVIGVEDVLNVYVRYNPEVSGEFIVGPEGTIFMPLLGDVRAAGLTKAELQDILAEKLARFIKFAPGEEEELVAVGISQYRSKKVFVIGEVTRPGPVLMRGNLLTVWEAVNDAGLPLPTAALWRVHVITPDVEDPVVKRINLRSIMYGGKLAQNDFLQAGDIVVVPSSVATSLGSYLGQIITPANYARRMVEVYEFFKNKSYFLDTEYGRFQRAGF
jgi:polysaccharide export outer membrane protein